MDFSETLLVIRYLCYISKKLKEGFSRKNMALKCISICDYNVKLKNRDLQLY